MASAQDTHQETQKEKYARLFQRGLRWLGAGVLLMAVSFGVNFFVHESLGAIVISMYILTTAGAVCIFKGLVDMLG